MSPDVSDLRLDRIFIIGGSGSGKTTLARHVGDITGTPVYDLDQIARVGGGTGTERSNRDRTDAVRRILRERRWVAEGIHLGWTKELADRADVIVWLDHLPWHVASRRIISRFIAGGVAEFRRQKGLRKLTRIGDYIRHTRDLARAIPESRRYQGDPSASGAPGTTSRAATTELLAPYEHKLIHCRVPADVAAFQELVRSRASERGTTPERSGPDGGDVAADQPT